MLPNQQQGLARNSIKGHNLNLECDLDATALYLTTFLVKKDKRTTERVGACVLQRKKRGDIEKIGQHHTAATQLTQSNSDDLCCELKISQRVHTKLPLP